MKLFSRWGALSLAAALVSLAASLPTEKIERIDAAVRSVRDRARIPGLSVAIFRDFQPAWEEGFGLADLENSVPATAATVYRLGSISKPITAVAVMQLVEGGKMDLDAPIQTYVPTFPRKPWPVTVRDLLRHQSGIRHYTSLTEIESTRHYSDLLEPLRVFQDEPLVFEPGTHYLYSTYGYCLLGAAVEGASGMKFLDYLRERVFAPAAMETIQQDDVYRVIQHRARGYRRRRTGEIENCSLADTSNKIPGGGLVSAAEDLVRFAAALERGVLVKKETFNLMATAQPTRDGKPTDYGLGLRIVNRGGRTWVGHSGGQPGVSTLLLTLPGRGFAVAVMANLEGLDLAPLTLEIAEIAMQ